MKGNKSGIRFLGKSVYFNADKYPCVKWVINGKSRTVTLHRLVWFLTYGDFPKKPLTINHIDGDKMNWSIDNLEAISQADNVRHAWEIGLCKAKVGSKHGRSVLDEIKVLTILTVPNKGKNGRREGGFTNGHLSKLYGVSETRINNIRNGREWLHVHKALA